MMPGLGRLPDRDSRDAAFPVRALVPQRSARPYRYWYDNGAWLNQGNTGTCVGHGWAHWVEDSPITPTGTIDPIGIYKDCCKIDPWPENDNGDLQFGTSTRAGAKVLMNRGLVREYRWGFTLADIVDAVLEIGPVVVGTNWYEGMFETVRAKDAYGEYREMLVISGDMAGGHCWLLNGCHQGRKTFRMKNSWGKGWGVDGRATVAWDTMKRLIEEDGEMVIAVQTGK